MNVQEPFYLHLLRESFSRRQRANNAYSLRAYARDLEIDSSNLSAILQGKRSLPNSRAEGIVRKLGLPEKEASLFLSSSQKKAGLNSIQVRNAAKKYLLSDRYFRVIAEWEYYAFLQLLETADFRHDLKWIAKRLGITKSRSAQVLKNLLALDLVERTGEKGLCRKVADLETTENVASSALQVSHREALELAKKKLASTPIENRDFSSITMAIDPSNLPAARAIIREFQDKLSILLGDKHKSEVYQFNCQLFPLSQKDEMP